MTQAELASMLRVSAPHISNLEADKSNPSDMLVNSVCLSWHIDEHWLRTGEGVKEDSTFRLREAVKEQPDLNRHIDKLVIGKGSRDQLAYLFGATYPQPHALLNMLSQSDAQDFLARLNLLIKEWDDSRGNTRKRARIEVRIEDAIEDFSIKLNEFNKKKRLQDDTVISFSEMLNEDEEDTELRRITLPVLGRAAAGAPKDMIELEGDELIARNDEDHIVSPGDFVVIADGDSMVDAGIHDGDYCVIHQTPDVENGQIALVAVGDGSTIKRFYKDDDGVRLVPCNDQYKAQHYPPNASIRVLGHFIKAIPPEA